MTPLPSTTPDRSGTPSFTGERLQWLLDTEERHFWFAGRRRLVRRLLARHAPPPPCRVLDLGVGGGLFTEQLAGEGYRMIAVDFLPHGLQRLRRSSPGTVAVQSTAEALALAPGSVDAALALDVLEHTDDTVAMRGLVAALRPGGVAIVTVPAFGFLWSVRDDDAGHRRRYTRRSLRALIEAAGLEPLELGYYQCLLFPFVLASRVSSARRRTLRDLEDVPPPVVNGLLRAVNRLEVGAGRIVRWPVGSSVYAVARKH